ncbi:MAG TPA: YdcF family protein [Candidatus Nitrosocosmicus sp.]|nr:YdcF family protein [Candidatus Nitrosocosmicus sp.]
MSSPRVLPDGKRSRALRLLGAAALLLLGVGGFTPLANGLNRWMAGPRELQPAQAIVVPGRGGSDSDEVLTNASLRRTLRAIALQQQGLSPLIVFSGENLEVDARVQLARGLGIAAESLLPAYGGRTTREEAVLIEGLLKPRGVQRILLVADSIDMPRARALFEARGFTVLGGQTWDGGPSDPESRLHLLREIAIELSAWCYYRLRGWI